MRTLISIGFMSIMIFFASCDGRDRMHKSSKEVLQESKLLDSFSENVTYFPETYSEVVTDTLLSNGTSVRIKTFSDMENNVLHTFKSDTLYFKHFYRDFKAEVSITKASTKTVNYSIDKAFLKKHDTLSKNNKTFYNNAVIQSIMLLDYDSITSNNIVLSISLCKPETDDCMVFEMLIDEHGEFELHELELDKTV